MKPISVITFIASIFVLGISLLWYPKVVALVGAWFPAATPDWVTTFVGIIPYLSLSMILLFLCWKVAKRGRPKTFGDE